MRAFTEPEMKVMAVNMGENIATSINYVTKTVSIANTDTVVKVNIDTNMIVDSILYDEDKKYGKGNIPSKCKNQSAT